MLGNVWHRLGTFISDSVGKPGKALKVHTVPRSVRKLLAKMREKKMPSSANCSKLGSTPLAPPNRSIMVAPKLSINITKMLGRAVFNT